MQALFGGGGGPPHFRDVPEPVLTGPLEVLVRPLAVALCDLDVAYIANLLPTAQPYAIGHEFTAEVVAVGDAVVRFVVGDHVTVPFQISCGSCDRCQGARTADCRSVPPLSAFGLAPFDGGEWGAAATSLVRVPYGDAMCVLLPDGVDPVDLASVSDNVVDGYRGVAPYVVAGDEVIVFGSQSVGLYSVATAAALGVPCTYVDDDPSRLVVAERLGACAIEASPDGRSFGDFPVSVACISTAEGLISAVRSTEPGGVCHSSGIQYFPVELPLFDLYRRGIRLVTGRPHARVDIDAVLKLVRQGRLAVAEVTASVIDFDDAPEALAGPLPHKTVLRMTSPERMAS